MCRVIGGISCCLSVYFDFHNTCCSESGCCHVQIVNCFNSYISCQFQIVIIKHVHSDEKMVIMDFREILNRINLKEVQILEHLAFLRYYDENPVYLQENILKQAIQRYIWNYK